MDTETTPLIGEKSLASHTYSFGVEIELIMIPYEAKIRQLLPGFNFTPTPEERINQALMEKRWVRDVVKILQETVPASGLSTPVQIVNQIEENGKPDNEKSREPYSRWSVTRDASLDSTIQNAWCVEIVSRVMFIGEEGGRWLRELRDITSVLENYFEILRNKTTSTHVHLKKVVNGNRAISIEDARQMAKFVAFWEPCIYHLLPPQRRNSTYALMNLLKSEEKDGETNLRKTLTRESFWTYLFPCIHMAAKTYQDVFDRIDSLSTLKEVAKFMDGTGRYWAWNFNNLYDSPKTGSSPTYTIEFRSPPGSTNSEEVLHWITLGLSFMNLCYSNSTDSPLYRNMAQTVCPKLDDGSVRTVDNTQNQDLWEWSKKELDALRRLLLESAENLSLGSHLHLDKYSGDIGAETTQPHEGSSTGVDRGLAIPPI